METSINRGIKIFFDLIFQFFCSFIFTLRHILIPPFMR